jgi:hypothetical protein
VLNERNEFFETGEAMTRPARKLAIQEAAKFWSQITGTPRPHRCTVLRWSKKGIRGRRLRAEQIGGRWFVTPDAVEEFHRHMTRPAVDCIDQAAGPTRAAQIAKHHDELDRKIARKV